MVSPNTYIGITYLHLLGATGVIGVSSQKLISDWKHWPLVSGLVSFLLLFIILFMKVGILKYGLFFAYLLLLGQSFHSFFKTIKEEDNELMNKVLGGAIGFYIVMSIVGFMDKGGILSWGKYLMFGLIGLLLGYFGIFVSSLSNVKEETIEKMKDGIALVSLAIFAGLISYDTKILQIRARKPEVPHDFIDASMGLFLDMINVVLNLGELLEE